jgi:hypothetical protein
LAGPTEPRLTQPLAAAARFPDDQEVYPHHLSAAEITLGTYGIASRWDFVAELRKISSRV